MFTFPIGRGGGEREEKKGSRKEHRIEKREEQGEKDGRNREEERRKEGRKEGWRRKIVKMVRRKDGRRRQGNDAGKRVFMEHLFCSTLSGPTTRPGKPPG